MDAVYWPPVSLNTFGRPVTQSEPVFLDSSQGTGVRWEDVDSVQIDSHGRTFNSRAMIYVGMDVQLGGFLYKGTPNDPGFDPTSPFNNPGTYEIKRINNTPTLRGDQVLRVAFV